MLCEAGISTVQYAYLLTQKEGTVLHLWYIQCVHMSGMHTLGIPEGTHTQNTTSKLILISSQ